MRCPLGAKRNPRWNRDELILCLDLYLREGPNASTESRQALAETLNSIRLAEGDEDSAWSRSAGSVERKLGNFLFLDSNGQHGSENLGAEDKRVWLDLASSRAAAAGAAKAIRSREVDVRKLALQQAGYEMAEAPEGRILTLKHQVRERNPALVRRKKQAAMKAHGCIACEACGFDYSSKYGERGDGFIECHHTIPVSEMDEEHTTRMADLALLCANCHRMIHRRTPWLTLAQLRLALGIQ